MKVGLFLNTQFPEGTDVAARVPEMVDQVRVARDAGFKSLWFPHHWLTYPMQMLQITPVMGFIAAHARAEAPPTPVSLLTTPLFHVTANNCGAYAVTAGGGVLVLMYRWDAGEALRLIERERVTAMSGVPVMSRELLAHPDFAKHDTSSLMSLGGGGAPLQPDLVAKILTISPRSLCRVLPHRETRNELAGHYRPQISEL